MESVHSTLSLACIVKKLDQGSLDAEFVDGVIHNQLQSEPISKIHENEREKIKKLATSIANLKIDNMPMNAKIFMARSVTVLSCRQSQRRNVTMPWWQCWNH